jgi:hypothetical protein
MLPLGTEIRKTVLLGTEDRAGLFVEWWAEVKVSTIELDGPRYTTSMEPIIPGTKIHRLAIKGLESVIDHNGNRLVLAESEHPSKARATLMAGAFNCEPFTGVILNMWENWNLNDLNAWCDHQFGATQRGEIALGDRCPECGYGYGLDWLVRLIPARTLKELEEILGATI